MHSLNLNDFTDTFFLHSCTWRCSGFFFFFFEKIENVSTSVGDAMFWQCMVQSPPVQGFHKVSRSTSPSSLMFIPEIFQARHVNPWTGVLFTLHHDLLASRLCKSKCHISTLTWSRAVPTDIHQNLVQSTLRCVCRADIFTGQIAALVFDPKWSNVNAGSYILISVTLKRNVNLYLPNSETVCIRSDFVFFFSHVGVFSVYIVSAVIKFWKIHHRGPCVTCKMQVRVLLHVSRWDIVYQKAPKYKSKHFFPLKFLSHELHLSLHCTLLFICMNKKK